MPITTLDPIRLYDGPAPGSEDWTHTERTFFSEIFQTEAVVNVVDPTLTPVLPDQPNGTAVVIAPGGGYHALSIQSEGHQVAEWLAARGVTAFVLRYRLVPGGDDPIAELIDKMAAGTAAASMSAAGVLAGADAETAMRLVRARAREWGVDPGRVGFIGFSAGGNVTARVALTDDAAARPNFVAPIYAAVRDLELSGPPPGSGPMFLVAATDDQLGLAEDSIRLYEFWRAAGLPVELHMYAAGGHGFGMRTQGLPSDSWIDRFGDWLGAQDLL